MVTVRFIMLSDMASVETLCPFPEYIIAAVKKIIE
jgi:hypothetical protein